MTTSLQSCTIVPLQIFIKYALCLNIWKYFSRFKYKIIIIMIISQTCKWAMNLDKVLQKKLFPTMNISKSYGYKYWPYKACSNSETGVHGTFWIPLRPCKSNSKTLLLNRLFSTMISLKTMAILRLNIDRKIFKLKQIQFF